MAMPRIVSTYKDLWSDIQGLVLCIVTAVKPLLYNKLDQTIF